MKRTILATALMLMLTAASAQNNTEKDSTVIITHPDTVKITNSQKQITIEVKNNGTEYKLHREVNPVGVTVIKERKAWDFDIPPFIGPNKKKQTHQHNATFDIDIIHNLQFGVGLVSATEQAAGMDIKWANSGWEFTLNRLINCEYRAAKNTSLMLNFGVNWRNFRMKGENRFLKEGSHLTVAPYPDGSDVNFSRIKIFSTTLELMLRQKLTRGISASIGPVINFNSHGSIKTRYKHDGKGYKDTSSNINQNAVTIDYKAEIAFNDLSFYFKYSPVNMLDTSYGPKFRPMSAGILLAF